MPIGREIAPEAKERRPLDVAEVSRAIGGSPGPAPHGPKVVDAARPAAEVQPPREVTWSEAVRHVASEAKLNLQREGAAEFRFRVSPPEMGEIRIRLAASQQGVTADLTVANKAVQQLVEARLPELRQRLELAGIAVNAFNVAQDGGSSRQPQRDLPRNKELEASPVIEAVPAVGRPRPATLSRGLVDVTA
jgi:flagellar hook-length control protein FliK